MEETLETVADSAATVLLVVQCAVPPPGAPARAIAAADALRPAAAALAESAQLCAQHAAVAPPARQALADAARDARDAASALAAAARAAARAVLRLTAALARAGPLAAEADALAAFAAATRLHCGSDSDSSSSSAPSPEDTADAGAVLLRRAARRLRACRRDSRVGAALATSAASLEAALVDAACAPGPDAAAAVERAADGVACALRRAAVAAAAVWGAQAPALSLLRCETAAVQRVRAASACAAAAGDAAQLAEAVRGLADVASRACASGASAAVVAACSTALDALAAQVRAEGADVRTVALAVRDVGAVLEAAVADAEEGVENAGTGACAAAAVACARASAGDTGAVLARLADAVGTGAGAVPPHARARALWRVLACEEDALVRVVAARGPAFQAAGAAHARAAAGLLDELRACTGAAQGSALEGALATARTQLGALVLATKALFDAPASDPACAALRQAVAASKDAAAHCVVLLHGDRLCAASAAPQPRDCIAACATTVLDAVQAASSGAPQGLTAACTDTTRLFPRLAEEAGAGVVECARAIGVRVASATQHARSSSSSGAVGGAVAACETWAAALKVAATQRLAGAPADALAHAAGRLAAALAALVHACATPAPPAP